MYLVIKLLRAQIVIVRNVNEVGEIAVEQVRSLSGGSTAVEEGVEFTED